MQNATKSSAMCETAYPLLNEWPKLTIGPIKKFEFEVNSAS